MGWFPIAAQWFQNGEDVCALLLAYFEGAECVTQAACR